VVIASRNRSPIDQAVTAIQASGGVAAGCVVEVSNLSQVESLAKFAVDTFGRLDIWVNNAGVSGPYGDTLDFSPETFQNVVQTNIMGVYYGSRVAMKCFIPVRAGKLINILGAGWRKPVPYQNAYSSSKVWIRWFTRSLAVETRNTGVGVFALNPGMVLTELLTDVEVFESASSRLDLFPMIVRALAKPPEVPAEKAVWLASSATDGKTGLEVNVFNPLVPTLGFMREGLRKLFKRSVPRSDVKIKVIPPAA
jgi:NAD(P)-dependent dehydrogenase (short-subunit alcohol dehydrogenase family)